MKVITTGVTVPACYLVTSLGNNNNNINLGRQNNGKIFLEGKERKDHFVFPVPKTPVVLFHGVMDPFILSGGHAAGLFLFCFVPVSQLTPIEGISFSNGGTRR